MPAYNDTVDDFNLKWGHTWAYLKDQIVYVGDAHYDENKENGDYYVTLVEYPNNEQKKIHHLNFDLTSLTPLLFDSQFFNCHDFAYSWKTTNTPACLFVSRVPRRQNKRSLNEENTVFHCPISCVTGQRSGKLARSYGIAKPYIDRVLAHQFPTYTQALALCNDHLAVAISPNFAVSLSTISKDKCLLLNHFGFIGEADATKLYIHHQGSIQEINDFVRRHNLNLEVINAKYN